MNKKLLLIGTVILIVLAAALIYMQYGKSIYTTTPESPPKESSPLQAKLSFSDKPLLNAPVGLVLTLKSMMVNNPNVAFQNTSARIELPDGFEFVSGELEWHGYMSANEERKVEAVVKSTKLGYYKITGVVQGEAFGNSDIIYLEVSDNDAIMGSKPANNWFEPAQGQAVPMPENNGNIKSELLILQKPELNKEFMAIYRITPLEDILDTRYRQMSLLFPPKGFEVSDVKFPEGGKTYRNNGQLSWQGDLSKNQTVEIRATFKIIDVGWGSIIGELSIQAGTDGSKFVQDAKIADLYVDKYSGNLTIR
ncbi:MAG: hypothetical protein WA139_01520 [Candidatus Aenigmatarchaeota archaeon]